MKALGRNDQAYEYWWKAIQLQPTYWDAIVCLNFLFSTWQFDQTHVGQYARLLVHTGAEGTRCAPEICAVRQSSGCVHIRAAQDYM